MPYVKPISGHTSCRFVQEYLEKNGRALARDFLELEENDSRTGMSWSAQMDETREVYGNDRSVNGGKVRTYNHYVLSPDPKDNISLEELRTYTTEWASKAFPGYQIAIIYHNDSHERLKNGERGILHAHLIVNNTNLNNGRRLAPWLTHTRVRNISRLAQDMAKKRGWKAFDWEKITEEKSALRGFSVERKKSRNKAYKRGVTRQDNYYTRSELAVLKDRGWSWKEDLRARIRIARELSCTEREFMDALRELGVKLGRTKKGDYLYTHITHNTWCAGGMTLGKQYTRNVVIERLNEADSQRIKEKDQKRVSEERRAITLVSLEYFAIDKMRTIGWLACDGTTTLKDVADMLQTNREFNIVHTSDYKSALKGLNQGSPDYLRIDRAMKVAEKINLRNEVPESFYKKEDIGKPQLRKQKQIPLRSISKKQGSYDVQKIQRKVAQKDTRQDKDRRQR